MGISSTRVRNDFFNVPIRVWAIPSVTSLHCIILQIWILNSHGDHRAIHYLVIGRVWGNRISGLGGIQKKGGGEGGGGGGR